MKARFVTCSSVLLCHCFSLPAMADEPKGQPFKPTAVFSGTHSEIKKERFAVVLAAEEWKRLWEEHRGKENRFTETHQEIDIDFETHYIVAIFTGPCDWCGINARIVRDELRIGFKAHGHQTEGGGEFGVRPETRNIEKEKKQETQAPYSFVILRRPVKPVVIEQDIQSTLSEPPLWKRRVSLPAANK